MKTSSLVKITVFFLGLLFISSFQLPVVLATTNGCNSTSMTESELQVKSGEYYWNFARFDVMDVLQFQFSAHNGTLHFILMDEDNFRAYDNGENYSFKRYEYVTNRSNVSLISFPTIVDYPQGGTIYYVLYNAPVDGYDIITLEFSVTITNILEMSPTTTAQDYQYQYPDYQYQYPDYQYSYQYSDSYQSNFFPFSLALIFLVLSPALFGGFVMFYYLVSRGKQSKSNIHYRQYRSAKSTYYRDYRGTSRLGSESSSHLRSRSYQPKTASSVEQTHTKLSTAAKITHVFCTACGTRMDFDDKFCMNCGTKTR
ncbi:MAG: zinc ribbon domain-containing protein [Candidatus Odinarchaeota archaeon]